MGPSLNLLYLHPVGNSTSLGSTERAGNCVVTIVGLFQASAMGCWGRASSCQSSDGAIGPVEFLTGDA